MSIFNWVIAHPKLSLMGTIVGGGGILSASVAKANAHDESQQFLFRSVPEQKEEQDWSEIMDNKKFEDMPLVEHSYKKLIYGDESYNGGNYVIYYGSEACSHCTGFLFGDQSISKGNLWHERDHMSNGAWMQAFESVQLDKDLKDKKIKFLMFEDVPDIKKTNIDDSYWTLPWMRWLSDDLAKGRIKGEYVRNDQSAKDFRKIFQAAQERFGQKVAGTPTVIVYKEGRPALFNHDKLPGLETNQQDESLSSAIELKKFIKHYYGRVEWAPKKNK